MPESRASAKLRDVTTWTLECTERLPASPKERSLPEGVRIELARDITPEFDRYLYAVVGGPWTWIDRLGWSRDQWASDLSVPGTETYVATRGGVPLGYVQIQPTVTSVPASVEIRYFGLVEQAIGHGLGATLLRHGVDAAWSLGGRHELPQTERVWLHTCSLDGPAALANYRTRGFVVIDETVTKELVPESPPGSWIATGGPASAG